MPGRIVHEGWGLFEYPLPIEAVPEEMDAAWDSWIAAYVAKERHEIAPLIERRFRACSAGLRPFAERVLQFIPASIVVFEGVPHVRLANPNFDRRFISIAPELSFETVCESLAPYSFAEHSLLVEYFAIFGDTNERSPGGDICIPGKRERGGIVIEPAAVDFDAGLEYCTDAEVNERQRNFVRWHDGVQVLDGGDGLYWHLGRDGSVCEHECGESDVGGLFDSLQDMIDALVVASTDELLFEGAYVGLPGKRMPHE